MKKKATKLELRKTSIFLKISLSLICLSLVSQNSFASHCSKASKYKHEVYTKAFKQDPHAFTQELFKDLQSDLTQEQQNKLFKMSFDIARIYRSLFKTYKSKVVGGHLISYLQSQINGQFKNLYNKSNEILYKKNYDLLSDKERADFKNKKVLITKMDQRSCNDDEKKYYNCSSNLVIVDVQINPSISCKKKNLKETYSARVFYTYTPKYGFKVLELDFAGKRLLKDALIMVKDLKSKNHKKTGVISKLAVLSGNKQAFKLPKKLPHSNVFLTSKMKSQDRLPSSL